MGTRILQNARLLCDKRRAYAAVGEGLDTGSAIRFSGRKGLDNGPTISLLSRKGSGYKNGHLDFAGCPIAMRQAHGLCYSRRGAGR